MARRADLRVWIWVVAWLFVGPLQAETAKGADAPKTGSAVETSEVGILSITPNSTRMGADITVCLSASPRSDAKTAFDPGKYKLFINGHAFPSITGHGGEQDSISFKIRRAGSKEEIDEWNRILGGSFERTREMNLSIGTSESSQIGQTLRPGRKTNFTIEVYSPGALTSMGIGLGLLLVAFLYLAKKSALIRDAGTKKTGPYSLARLQMAVWFFVVLASFIFIYTFTADTHTISGQALALMGIGSGTALGAAVIEVNKRGASSSGLAMLEPQAARLTAEIVEATKELGALPTSPSPADLERARSLRVSIAEKTVQVSALAAQIGELRAPDAAATSQGFINDILTDASGLSFHRFQMLAWTIVLVCIFINGVFGTLAMPTLDPTLLALMGISAGTYLGFKIPEKQT